MKMYLNMPVKSVSLMPDQGNLILSVPEESNRSAGEMYSVCARCYKNTVITPLFLQ